MENIIKTPNSFIQKIIAGILAIFAFLFAGNVNNVSVTVSKVTTESKIIYYEFVNKTGKIIGNVEPELLEKKDGEEWVEVKDVGYFTNDIAYRVMPFEKWHDSMELMSENYESATLDEGEYRITFRYYCSSPGQESEEGHTSATFTVVAA
ncbi:MAG: immunoglobulin-like domain-containing protein [Acutalibacteraceae bacterium]